MKVFLFILLFSLASIGQSVADNTSPPPPHLKLQNSAQQQQQPPHLENIRDIREPVLLPDTNKLLPPLIIGGVLIFLAVLLFLFLRRKKPQPPPPDPGTIALAGLDAARHYMKEGQSLHYAEKISEILRGYIEKRFQIQSTRQTTDEFFIFLTRDTQISTTPLHAHAKNLKKCLERCDMAKFAHSSPGSSDMEHMEHSVRTFVTKTTPVAPTQGGN